MPSQRLVFLGHPEPGEDILHVVVSLRKRAHVLEEGLPHEEFPGIHLNGVKLALDLDHGCQR